MSRIRTGLERVIAHMCNKEYAISAEQDGIVYLVDEQLKIAKIKYKDNTIKVVNYNDYVGLSSGILYVQQEMRLNVKQGEKIKKGDVLVYNAGFFIPEYGTKQVLWKHGVHAYMAFIENEDTHEDGNAMSLRLSNALVLKSVEKRKIKLRANSVIHNYKWIGDTVSSLDILCETEEEDSSELAILDGSQDADALMQLNRKATKSGIEGVITDINVLYSCPISEMTPSVASFVRKAIALKNKKAKIAEGTANQGEYIKSTQITPGSKYRGTTFYDDTILIEYFLLEELPNGTGDKTVFDTCAKTVSSHIYTPEEQPITESGILIDEVYSEIGIFDRIILSPKRQGIGERVLEKLEQDITADI